jgi:Raf kinase inhibitor-like YbhB/YbcL family protein
VHARLGFLLAGLILAIAGCGSSGPSAASGESQATSGIGVPATAATPTIAPTTNAVAASASPLAASGQASASPVASAPPAAPFAVTSGAFRDGGGIPSRFTCDGADVSPAIDWTGAPDGTKSLLLRVIDPDAGDFVHWLAYDIAGSPAGGLPEKVSPSADAPRQGTNSFGKRGYGGPCPPSGTHHYRFALSALDTTLALPNGANLGELRVAMKGHVLAASVLTGTYRRH